MKFPSQPMRAALAVVMVIALAVFLPELKNSNPMDWMMILPASPGMAGMVLFLLFCIKSIVLIIPATLLYLAAGLVFPPMTAVVFTAFCLVVEMTIGYYFGQQLGENRIEAFLSRYRLAGRVTEYIRGNSFLSVLAVRLIPGTPPDLVSMLLGAARIDYPEFLTASILGLMPAMVSVILIGSALVQPNSGASAAMVAISAVLMGGALIIGRYLINDYRLQEQVEESSG